MQLPIVFPGITGQRFECRSCTRCCRELVVHLTEQDREKIDRQNWGEKIAGGAYMRLGDTVVLRHGADGACVFLGADGLCRIHADFGATEKPLACQMFPFTVERTGDAVHASIRLDCPTAAKSDGRPLSTFRAEVTRLAEAAVAQRVLSDRPGAGQIELSQGVKIGLRSIDRMMEKLDRWSSNDSMPLGRRLGGLCELTRTLSAAKLGRLGDAAAGELLDVLVGGIEELASESESKPLAPPTGKQSALLRQAVFSHTEQITFEQIASTWWPTIKLRMDQLRRARGMVGGRGSVPRLRGIQGAGTFETIEAVSGDHAAMSSVVGRYLSSRIQGRSCFGGGYYGWSVVDGLSALLISVACIGWLARCSAAARGVNRVECLDAENAVGLVDRAGGRVPELGARSGRLRVQYLSDDDGVARLIRRYAI